MLRDFKGNDIEDAYFSSPIQLVGFDNLPPIGSTFATFESKKDAEQAITEFSEIKREFEEAKGVIHVPEGVALIPIVLKTDVSGTAEAICGEINKLTSEDVIFKVIKSGSGDINESDVKLALSDESTVIIGFHVNEDPKIKGLNEYEALQIKHFDIIYKLTEYLVELHETRRIKKEVKTEQGQVRVLKVFSHQKNVQVIGGKVVSGEIKLGHDFMITRKHEDIGRGIITALQEGKIEKQLISSGNECGIMITSKVEINEGDTLITFIKEIK